MTSDDPQLTQESSSSMTLGLLLDNAFAQRWTAAALVVASLVTGVLAALFLPIPQRAQVLVFPLSDFEALEYQTPYFLRHMKVEPPLLQGLYVETVRNGGLLRTVLIDKKVVTRSEGQSEADFALALERAMAKLTLTPPSPENIRVGNKNWTISYEARDAAIGYDVLSDYLVKVTQFAKTRLTARYEKSLSEYEQAVNFQMDEQARKRQNLMDDYDRMTRDKLAQLDEQAELLKSTGAKRGQIMSPPNETDARDKLAVIDTSKVVFLPGYEQVEKQAALMRARVNKESFIPGLLEVDQEIRRLKQDRNVAEGRAAFDATPLARDDFMAVTYDLNRASFRKIVSPVLIVVGALFAGLGMAVCLILFSAFRQAKRNDA